jgi:leucyl-tRNA synthetase
MERLQFNTCVTELIKFVYSLEELATETCDCGVATLEHEPMRHSFETLLVLLSPFSPHLCAELWSRLELPIPLSQAEWPKHDAELLTATSKPITVKVNARTVARLDIPAQASRKEALAIAYEDAAVRSSLGEARVSREIYVPGQVINFVTVGGSAVPSERDN